MIVLYKLYWESDDTAAVFLKKFQIGLQRNYCLCTAVADIFCNANCVADDFCNVPTVCARALQKILQRNTVCARALQKILQHITVCARQMQIYSATQFYSLQKYSATQFPLQNSTIELAYPSNLQRPMRCRLLQRDVDLRCRKSATLFFASRNLQRKVR